MTLFPRTSFPTKAGMGMKSWYPVPKTTGIVGIGTSASTEALVVPVPNTIKNNDFWLFGTGNTKIPKPLFTPVFGKSTDNQYSYQWNDKPVT
jgi:hypothetical protein